MKLYTVIDRTGYYAWKELSHPEVVFDYDISRLSCVKGLAIDLALVSGFAFGRMYEMDIVQEIRSRIVVESAGLLAVPGDGKTPNDEGSRLRIFAGAVDMLMKRYAPLVVFFESAVTSSWQRSLRRTGHAQATLAALRGVLLEHVDPLAVLVEIKPEEWQPSMIGRVKRELGKENSIMAARQRLGVVTDNHNISDACLVLEYGLLRRWEEGGK